MITVTYDYTGQNYHCSNYTKIFEIESEFINWLAVNKPYIWHVNLEN